MLGLWWWLLGTLLCVGAHAKGARSRGPLPFVRRLPCLSAIVLSLSLMPLACGDGDRTDCETARARLEECGRNVFIAPSLASYQRLPLVIDDDCTGLNGCAADCVNASTCDAMNSVLLGPSGDPNTVAPPGAGKFNYCLNACIENYRKP